MKKRIFSVLTALCLCLTLLPTAALAADPPTSGTDDVSTTGLDLSTLPSDTRSWKTGGSTATITYNDTDKKLTLNGAAIDASTGGTALNLGSNRIEIVLEGTNTLTGNITGSSGVSFTGSGSVSITGNVTVSAASGNITANSNSIAAIQASGGANVTVNGSVSVSATSGNITGTSTNPVAGVHASDANTTVTVSGGVSLSANKITSFSDQTIFGVQASGGAQVTVGSVTMTATATATPTSGYTMEYASGVEVSGHTAGKKTTVTVNGAIEMKAASFKEAYGIKETSGGGSAVTAGSVSIGDGTENKGATGVHAEQGGAAITIKGDVTVDGEGVVAGGGDYQSGTTYDYKSGSQVTVQGSVKASNTGVKAGGGSVVTVQGDVTGSGLDAATAAVVGDSSGTITVGGNVTNTNSDGKGVGVYINGSNRITVGGNVTGGNGTNGVGLNVRLSDSSSQGSITIKGTVSGSTSLKFSGSGNNLTVDNLPSMKIGSYNAESMKWGDNSPSDTEKQQILSKVQKYVEPVVTPPAPAPSASAEESDPTYSISVPKAVNGEVTVRPRYAEAGDTVTLTVTPREGFLLESLTVTDQRGRELALTDNGDGTFSFKMPAGRVSIRTSFVPEPLPSNPFSDVPADAYYLDAVLWALKHGITGGVTEDQFAPGASCTRSQIVTFLYRWAVALGADVSSGADTNILSYNDALDIPEYAIPAFQWAVSAGILQGSGGNLLSNQSCTRAQTVAFLYRFAAAIGMDLSVGEDTNILSYNDAFDIPEYAIPAFQWAVGMGILQGSNGNLMSNQTCTRAQIVTFLFRTQAAQ